MSRIIISLVVALGLVLGTLFIKHERTANTHPQAALIATEIDTLNAPAIAQYAAELQASATTSDDSADSSTTDDVSDVPAPPLNATEQLSQNLFTQYVSLKESGVDVTADGVAQQVADNLLSQTYTTGTTTTYTQNDLIINAQPTKQDLINYGNVLGTILSTPLPAGAEQEVQIFETFAETNDASVLANLSVNIARYTDMQKNLLAMSVPETFADDHLAIMNAFSLIIHDIEVVETSATDPVGAETVLADYPNEVSTLGNALSAEKIIFLENNVSFSPDDAGYLITK